MLTAKEDAFARYVFEGMSLAAAKKRAYTDCHLKGNALYVEASELAAKPKVKLRIQEMRDKAVAPAIADVRERKLHASGVMRNPKASHRDQLTANKLVGEYEQDFVQRSENLNVHLDVALRDMTREEVRAFLSAIEYLQSLPAAHQRAVLEAGERGAINGPADANSPLLTGPALHDS